MDDRATGIKSIMPRKFVRNMEDYGIRIALQKTLKYLTQPIFNQVEFILYEIDLSRARGKEILNQDLEFKLIDAGDHAEIRQIEEMEEWLKDQMKEKLASGAICMVVLDNGKLAGFNLATRGKGFIKLLKLQIETGKDEAWSEHITIQKDYRGRKLANDLRNHFYVELQNQGITALYGHRQEFNVASRGSAKKYTVKEIGRATYKSFFGFDRLLFTSADSPRQPEMPIGRTGNGPFPFSATIHELKG